MNVPVPAVLPDSRLAPAQIRAKFNSRTLAGIGSCGDQIGTDESGAPIYDTASCTGSAWPTPVYTGEPGTSTPGTYQPTTVSAGTGISAGELAAITTAMKGGIQLASILAMNPGMTVSPNGTITYQNPGYPIQIPGTGTLPATLGGISTTTLMLVGVGLVVVVSLLGSRR
jgi:hypothetical protein